MFHRNMPLQEAAENILCWMKDYRQLEIFSEMGQASVLVSKKGKVTIKERKASSCVKKGDLSHNRKKKYILDPAEKVDFLVDLGVQTREGNIVHAKYDKFRQINRFLEYIEDILQGTSQRQRNNDSGFWMWKILFDVCYVSLFSRIKRI